MIPLADLLADPRKALDLPREDLPVLLTQMAALQTAMAARLAQPDAENDPAAKNARPGAEASDRWISAEKAHEISGLGVRWLYCNQAKIPGAKKFSKRRLRFHEAAFRKWLARRP